MPNDLFEKPAPKRYTVHVDDNFRYMDESERYYAGQFDTYDQALQKCKDIVDEFLQHTLKSGIPPSELYAQYAHFGEDPFIIPDDHSPRFSARDYASRRCQEIVAGSQQPHHI